LRVLVAMFRQRNFEKLPTALYYDDRSARGFATPRQFMSDPLGTTSSRGTFR
jgi:hypothetical protein